MCFADPLHSVYDLDEAELANPASFSAFLSSRCRAYILSEKELGAQEAGYRDRGCNCYSSGESLNAECIMPKAWSHMLAWLDQCYYETHYAEKVLIMASDIEPTTQEQLEAMLEDEIDYVAGVEMEDGVGVADVEEPEDEVFYTGRVVEEDE